MLEKVPSLRDFVIYVIPGTLLNIIVLALLFEFKLINLTISFAGLLESNTFIFSFILFSFLIGFIQSQLQIIIINKLIYRAKDIRTIANTTLPEEFKSLLVTKIRRDFKVYDLEDDAIMNDCQFLYLCFTNVLLVKNSTVIQNLNRTSYLSLFAASIILPVTLGYYYVSLKIAIALWLKILIFCFLELLTLYVCIKAVKVFRSEWISSVYKIFLIKD